MSRILEMPPEKKKKMLYSYGMFLASKASNNLRIQNV